MDSNSQKHKKYTNRFLFDYLRNITFDKSWKLFKEHVEQKDFNSFPKVVVLRYLTMCEDERVRKLVLDNQFLLEKMDNVDFYGFMLKNVPKQRTSFIKYLK